MLLEAFSVDNWLHTEVGPDTMFDWSNDVCEAGYEAWRNGSKIERNSVCFSFLGSLYAFKSFKMPDKLKYNVSVVYEWKQC